MNGVAQAMWVELLKARRSRMPLFTALGFALAPLAGGFFMVVLKDPELARSTGMISAKAQIVAGSADWATYLGLLAQATAIGGILVFGLIGSWVFGREYADGTVKDILALPTSRSAMVLAKFVIVAGWSAALAAMILSIGLVVGWMVELPPAPADVFVHGVVTMAVVAGLSILLVTPIAFFASAGHGYLPPMGVAILALILAKVVAAAGWGDYFPWSVPALLSGAAGIQSAQLPAISYIIVLATSLAGLAATFAWWELADHTQ